MKLNGWQRIGVVVSVLWAIGAPIYERNSIVNHSYWFTSQSSEVCGRAAKRAKLTAEILNPDVLAALEAESKEFRDCQERWLESAEEMRAVNGTAALNLLAVALMPIVVGWLLAFFSIEIFRWVRAGFGTNSSVPIASRSASVDAAPLDEVAAGGEIANSIGSTSEDETVLRDGRRPTPLWLALIAFAVAVLFVANRLMAQRIGVSPLAFLSDLPNVLPVLARHPSALMNDLAEATGTAVVIPLLHLGIASIFPSMRNKTSRRRIFVGWSVVGAIAATFL